MPREPGSILSARFYSGAGHVFSHLFFAGYAIVVVDLARQGTFGLDYAALLPMTGVGLFLYGLGAIPAGILGDRWSVPGMMVVFLVGTGVAAVATGLAQSSLGLWLGLSGIGLFSSIYHPVGIAWVAERRVRRGRTLGINGMLGAGTFALAPPLAGILTDTFSWRAAFIAPGILCLLLGLVLLAEMLTGRIGGERKRASLPPAESSVGDMRRAMVLLAIAVVGAALFFNVVTAVLPQLVADNAGTVIGTGMTSLGLAVAPFFLVGAFTQLIGGFLADRFPVKFVYAGSWALLLLAMGPVVLLMGSPVVLPFALLAVGLSLLGLPAENVMYAKFSPPSWRGTIYGVKFVLAFGIGWPAVELSGWLYGATGGFTTLFLVLAVAVALVLVCAILLPGGEARPGEYRFIGARAVARR